MANNITIPPTGTGTATPIVATIERSSAQRQMIEPGHSATATHANVTMTGSSVTAIASNVNRLGWSVYNDSGVVVYIKLAASASATSFMIKLQPDDFYEQRELIVYDGIVTAFGASGDIRVVEYGT